MALSTVLKLISKYRFTLSMTWNLFGYTMSLRFLPPLTPSSPTPLPPRAKFQPWRAACMSLLLDRLSGLLLFLHLSSHCFLCLEGLMSTFPSKLDVNILRAEPHTSLQVTFPAPSTVPSTKQSRNVC